MTDKPELHSSIVAMVSLASGIASRHPGMGLCQLGRLRNAGIPEHQIATVIEIARHIRDEATQKLDAAFDGKYGLKEGRYAQQPSARSRPDLQVETGDGCCTPTSSGQSCC